MKGKLKRCLVAAITLVVLLTQPAVVPAQVTVRATADRDSILIGEPVRLTVEAYAPLGASISWFRVDSLPHFNIIGRSAVDTAENTDGKKISQVLTITSFDSGTWELPPFEMMVDGQSYRAAPASIGVHYTPFDPEADYRDIKDIIDVGDPRAAYVPWVLGAISLLSLVALILLTPKRIRSHAQPAANTPPATPYEEAMLAFRLLQNRGVEATGEKQYYSEMNDIFRRYLARRFSIRSYEKTNEEIIRELSTLNLPQRSVSGLTEALRMSDFVKYARYTPSPADNEENTMIVRQAVETLENNSPGAV